LQNETCIAITSERRDFLYAKDVARALVRLVESDFSGATDIGSGEAVSIEEIARTVAGILGKQPRLAPDRSPERPVVQAQINLLKREIGWKSEYTLRSGLMETVEWWQTRLRPSVTNTE
jgi:nucleoside-diphosphate-sugar epimerase